MGRPPIFSKIKKRTRRRIPRRQNPRPSRKRPTRGEQAISAEPEILTPNPRQQEPSAARVTSSTSAKSAHGASCAKSGIAAGRATTRRARSRSPASRSPRRAPSRRAAARASSRRRRRGARRRTRRAFCRGSPIGSTAHGWAKPPPAKAKRGRAGGRAERSRYDKPSIASRLLAIAEREA